MSANFKIRYKYISLSVLMILAIIACARLVMLVQAVNNLCADGAAAENPYEFSIPCDTWVMLLSNSLKEIMRVDPAILALMVGFVVLTIFAIYFTSQKGWGYFQAVCLLSCC